MRTKLSFPASACVPGANTTHGHTLGFQMVGHEQDAGFLKINYVQLKLARNSHPTNTKLHALTTSAKRDDLQVGRCSLSCMDHTVHQMLSTRVCTSISSRRWRIRDLSSSVTKRASWSDSLARKE